MGSFSPIHWLILLSVLIGSIVMVIPIWRVLNRVGLNPAWSLLYFVPFASFIGLWIFAWAKWPRFPDHAENKTVQ